MPTGIAHILVEDGVFSLLATVVCIVFHWKRVAAAFALSWVAELLAALFTDSLFAVETVSAVVFFGIIIGCIVHAEKRRRDKAGRSLE